MHVHKENVLGGSNCLCFSMETDVSSCFKFSCRHSSSASPYCTPHLYILYMYVFLPYKYIHVLCMIIKGVVYVDDTIILLSLFIDKWLPRNSHRYVSPLQAW